MKTIGLLLFSIVSAYSGRLLLDHPNVLANFPEPELGYSPLTLDPEIIEKSAPQYLIWYTGGLVGYFANEWSAAIWTTPGLGFSVSPDDFPTESAIVFEPLPPVSPPAVPSPGPGPGPIFPSPPPRPGHPGPFDPHAVLADVPEPSTAVLWAIGFLIVVLAQRSRAQPANTR